MADAQSSSEGTSAFHVSMTNNGRLSNNNKHKRTGKDQKENT